MDAFGILNNSPVCRRLGIQYPVCQAGMGHVAHGDLAAAVSEAGGLGVIGSGTMTPEELQAEIARVRERTGKPFGVDILFAKVEGADPTTTRYTENVEALIEVTLDARVPVLISGLGNPKGVIAPAHERGMTVMSIVGNVRQAERLAGDGVDIIIASGQDGGGHVGRVGTMSLVPAVVDAVSVPVLAGGGLADGRALVAALALGACGVWMGTRFIATHEAHAHQNYKDKLVEIGDEGTLITRAHSGKPCRLVRNGFTTSWEGREHEIQPYPIQGQKVGHPASIRGRIEGDVVNGVLPAGQSSAMIHQVKAAGEVVRDIMEEARAVFGAWENQAAAQPLPNVLPGAD
jgi:enoyl-[acyl-carrier protein] reductase II